MAPFASYMNLLSFSISTSTSEAILMLQNVSLVKQYRRYSSLDSHELSEKKLNIQRKYHLPYDATNAIWTGFK